MRVAAAFDRSIDGRLKFNDLSTPEKLDLLIGELLPGFFDPENLPQSGRDSWRVRFVVGAAIERTVVADANGLRPPAARNAEPDVGLETDIMTLLRSVIADFHRKGPAATGVANITVPGDKAGA